MSSGTKGWDALPDHILIHIFSYIRLSDRTRAALVCRHWNECFQSPYLWNHFSFWFYMPQQSKSLKCLEYYGTYLKSVYIELDQAVTSNRENACKVIEELARQKERRLSSISLSFKGENPYFYAGKEFVSALSDLFGPVPITCKVVNPLKHVDLSGLTVAFDDRMLNELSANHPDLEFLNIQNKTLVCKVSPTCILRLVQRCRKLRDLRVFNCSLSEDILLSFTEDERVPLMHLSMVCRREEKYAKDLSGEIWRAVARKLPNLRVTLIFDHTCPLHKIPLVMKPEIPVSVLRLETFAYAFDQVRLATSHYHRYLEKLVLNTPMSPDLDEALVDLATNCGKLRAIHVFCVLEKATVEKILALRPGLEEKKTYTLKYTKDPHPWIAGNDC